MLLPPRNSNARKVKNSLVAFMCRSRTIWTGKDRVKFLLYEPSRKEPARIAGLAWNARPRLMEREKGAELRQLVVERRIEQIYLHVEPCSSRGFNASFFTSHSARRNCSQLEGLMNVRLLSDFRTTLIDVWLLHNTTSWSWFTSRNFTALSSWPS